MPPNPERSPASPSRQVRARSASEGFATDSPAGPSPQVRARSASEGFATDSPAGPSPQVRARSASEGFATGRAARAPSPKRKRGLRHRPRGAAGCQPSPEHDCRPAACCPIGHAAPLRIRSPVVCVGQALAGASGSDRPCARPSRQPGGSEPASPSPKRKRGLRHRPRGAAGCQPSPEHDCRPAACCPIGHAAPLRIRSPVVCVGQALARASGSDRPCARPSRQPGGSASPSPKRKRGLRHRPRGAAGCLPSPEHDCRPAACCRIGDGAPPVCEARSSGRAKPSLALRAPLVCAHQALARASGSDRPRCAAAYPKPGRLRGPSPRWRFGLRSAARRHRMTRLRHRRALTRDRARMWKAAPRGKPLTAVRVPGVARIAPEPSQTGP